ncbi:MAG: hypothetical protein HY283_02200 [Nitrospirae bacterium]|nr:hypothetical protein [Nitrospirota bacterium]
MGLPLPQSCRPLSFPGTRSWWRVFRGYHWLALTDGLIWGGLLLRTRNLSSTITAHAVEVIMVYSTLRIFYA